MALWCRGAAGAACLQLGAGTRGQLSVSAQASERIKIIIRQEVSLALPFVMWLLHKAASSLSLLGSPAQSTDALLCVEERELLTHSSLVALRVC